MGSGDQGSVRQRWFPVVWLEVPLNVMDLLGVKHL